MAVELDDLKIKPNPIQGLTIGQAPEADPLAAEKLKIQTDAQAIIKGNAARGEDLRIGLDKKFQTSDGQWYRYDQVTQSNKEGRPPALKPIQLDESGKQIDPKAAKQFLIPEISDWMKNDIKWPEYVPEKFRNEESFNKWNRGRYGLGYRQTQKVKVQDGLIVPQETGHFTASSDTNIGMNPWVGAQVKYGPEGNQTTTQKYIVEQGDTLVSVAEKFGVNPKQIKDANKGKVKKGIITSGQTIKIQTLKKNTDDTRLIADLEQLDMGGKDTRTSQFKAVEEWIGHFAPESEKGKYRVHTVDTLGARDMGKIGHDTEFDPTASGALEKIEERKFKAAQRQVEMQNNPIEPGLDKVKSPRGLFQKTVRTIARTAGTSNNPVVNITGDVVGAVMDGVAFAANPTAQNGIDLALSGGQVVTNLAALGIAALPIPGARPGAYALMKIGDNLAHVERMWGYGREGRAMIEAEVFSKKKPTIMSKQSGNEIAAIKKDLQTDKRMKRVRISTP